MIEVKTKLQKWGNSFGIVVPIKIVKEGGMKEGEEISALILPKEKITLRKIFGSHKFSKTTEQIMEETDRALYNE
ncbi:MAG: AbrB/MazE/SpoVT family DNA-binding domain-containing protein [archaeon]